MVSTHLKNISQNWNLPQVSNHHLGVKEWNISHNGDLSYQATNITSKKSPNQVLGHLRCLFSIKFMKLLRKFWQFFWPSNWSHFKPSREKEHVWDNYFWSINWCEMIISNYFVWDAPSRIISNIMICSSKFWDASCLHYNIRSILPLEQKTLRDHSFSRNLLHKNLEIFKPFPMFHIHMGVSKYRGGPLYKSSIKK